MMRVEKFLSNLMTLVFMIHKLLYTDHQTDCRNLETGRYCVQDFTKIVHIDLSECLACLVNNLVDKPGTDMTQLLLDTFLDSGKQTLTLSRRSGWGSRICLLKLLGGNWDLITAKVIGLTN